MASNDTVEANEKQINQLKLEIQERSKELDLYHQQNEDNNEYIE